ncbi:hypothetical protein HN51_026041, partial [Arachis hypogaea]
KIIETFCKTSREIIGELLKGISISLGQEENYIHKVINYESTSTFRSWASNLIVTK